MSASLYGETGLKLKAFRLLDIPLDIRREAAQRLARTNRTAVGDVKATDRLLAAVLDFAAHDSDEKDAIREAAEHPSGRVYYVPMTAWVAVMGR